MSGYTDERASLHDRLLLVVAAELEKRGYPSVMLEVSGHRPDAMFTDGSGFWDLKTGRPNLTIEIPSLTEYERIESEEERPVYIIHANVDDPLAWTADRISSIRRRQIGGVYTKSGNGSNDTGLLFRRGGTAFRESFPYAWEIDELLRH